MWAILKHSVEKLPLGTKGELINLAIARWNAVDVNPVNNLVHSQVGALVRVLHITGEQSGARGTAKAEFDKNIG
jgi:hypothetical protein